MVMAAPHSCARLCGAVLVLSGAALAAGAAVPRQASGSARTHVHMQGDNSMDLVGPLPGLSAKTCWDSYSGYLPVSGGKQLFYWYHEATSDAPNKPLVLWLNGGPGCSSLGGMFTEHGPYIVDKDQKLTLNPHSWNKVANVLYLEQPAGVGFSYPSVPADDNSTSHDTYEALQALLHRRPELQGRPFYIAGESYGGHYVPNTARAIEDGNAALLLRGGDKAHIKAQHINLVGFMVGNGYTDWQLDFNANVENGRFHALTSEEYFEAAKTACDGNYSRCFWPRDDAPCPADCHAAVQNATIDAMDGSIDIYDIYEDVCLEPGQSRLPTQAFTLLHERHRQQHNLQARRGRGRGLQTTISPLFPTCIDHYSATYLNTPAVQKAIHADSSKIAGGVWHDCGGVQYTFNYESELPNYRRWVTEGRLQILIYNGDADYILSHMGNAAWIRQGLGLPVASPWTKWRGSDKQVAGFFQEYGTANPSQPLTFLTVKGAGHLVPKDRPVHALDVFSSFLSKSGYDKVAPSTPTPLCAAP